MNGNRADVKVTRARVKRVAIRTTAAACYAGAIAVAYLLVAPVLESADPVEPAVAAAPAKAEAPKRPAAVPRQIPRWAWALSAWHDDRAENERPLDVPAPVPQWYWAWREWRLAANAKS